MTETPEQYKARLAAYVEGKDVMAMQRDAVETLSHLIEGVTPAELQQRPSPEKWSVAEILAHLAEDELTSTWRYRQMLEYEGPELPGFDQELWAKIGNYATWDVGDALRMFELLRAANLRMAGRLTPEQWDRYGIHAERGKMTVRDLFRHMAAHDRNHIDQIKRILKR